MALNSHKVRWIRKVERLGKEISIILIAKIKGEDWQEVERFLIARFRERGVRLTNQTHGGEGTKGLKHSEETKAKLRAASKRLYEESTNKFDAYGRTPAANLKRTNSLRGRVFSEETKRKMSQASIGKTHSEETKAKLRAIVKKQWERQREEGYKLSEEHKLKTSNSVKENWVKRRKIYGPTGSRRKNNEPRCES